MSTTQKIKDTFQHMVFGTAGKTAEANEQEENKDQEQETTEPTASEQEGQEEQKEENTEASDNDEQEEEKENESNEASASDKPINININTGNPVKASEEEKNDEEEDTETQASTAGTDGEEKEETEEPQNNGATAAEIATEIANAFANQIKATAKANKTPMAKTVKKVSLSEFMASDDDKIAIARESYLNAEIGKTLALSTRNSAIYEAHASAIAETFKDTEVVAEQNFTTGENNSNMVYAAGETILDGSSAARAQGLAPTMVFDQIFREISTKGTLAAVAAPLLIRGPGRQFQFVNITDGNAHWDD